MTSMQKTALTTVTGLIAAMIVVPPSVWSDTVGGLNTFEAGETALASEVNENFDAVEDAVDGNDGLIADLETLVAALQTRIEELEGQAGVPGPQGEQGEQGPQGVPGADGAGISSSPKTAFVTSETFDGNLGGIAGADAKCQNAADVAGLGGEWKAWISFTPNDLPAARFSFASRGYETMLGDYVGGRPLDSFPARVATKIDIDENGQQQLDFPLVWTGIGADGHTQGPICNAWTTNSNGNGGTVGDSRNNLNDGWTNTTNRSCDMLNRLYCFEQ